MITISRILGVTTLVGLLLSVSTLPGASLLAFYDPDTLLFLLVGTFGVLLIGTEPRDWRNAAAVLLRHQAKEDEQCRASAVRWFRMAGRAAISTGLIGYFLGLVIMLGNMDDPASVGSGVAVALLPLLYGAVLSEFFLNPLASSIDRRTGGSATPPGANTAFIALVVAISLLPMAGGILKLY